MPASAATEPKELAEISGDLKAGKVAEAQKLCAVLPRRWYEVTARLPYGASRAPQPGLYADLFARCAVASLRAGDAAQASWRWHSAHAFDPKMATTSARALGALAELPVARQTAQGLPGLAVQESKDWHEVERWMVGPTPQADLSAPPLLGPRRDRSRLSLRGGFQCKFGLEAILGRDGKLREPVVVSHEQCVPAQVLVILDALGERRYELARAESGEPIDVAYRLTLGDFTKSTSRDVKDD
ncbi:MAG: hypothetical protein ACREI7_00120 [Myxococcota bacterium]